MICVWFILAFPSFEVDKQLEDELRQMHAVVGDQQKRLDALVLENERLREQLQAAAGVSLGFWEVFTVLHSQ